MQEPKNSDRKNEKNKQTESSQNIRKMDNHSKQPSSYGSNQTNSSSLKPKSINDSKVADSSKPEQSDIFSRIAAGEVKQAKLVDHPSHNVVVTSEKNLPLHGHLIVKGHCRYSPAFEMIRDQVRMESENSHSKASAMKTTDNHQVSLKPSETDSGKSKSRACRSKSCSKKSAQSVCSNKSNNLTKCTKDALSNIQRNILAIHESIMVYSSNQNNEQQLVHHMEKSVSSLKNSMSFGFRNEKVCFEKIGCIYRNGPMKHLRTAPRNFTSRFFSYTEEDPIEGKEIFADDETSFSTIDSDRKLVIISHGFGSSIQAESMQRIKNSLLYYGIDRIGTVIMVDWKIGAASPDYLKACASTEVAGRQIAYLLERLRIANYTRPENVYLIGYSLGAHVSGFAGKYTQSEYGWKIGRITGLDSAAPLFEGYSGTYLTRTDADFVDAIHTSAGYRFLLGDLGFITPYAHVDFYPNNGTNQPMCYKTSTSTFPISTWCNHGASVLYYEASLVEKNRCQFYAYRCDSWNNFLSGHCYYDDGVTMGFDADQFAITHSFNESHIRFLVTNKVEPYCL